MQTVLALYGFVECYIKMLSTLVILHCCIQSEHGAFVLGSYLLNMVTKREFWIERESKIVNLGLPRYNNFINFDWRHSSCSADGSCEMDCFRSLRINAQAPVAEVAWSLPSGILQQLCQQFRVRGGSHNRSIVCVYHCIYSRIRGRWQVVDVQNK